MRRLELFTILTALSYLLWVSFGPGLSGSVLAWLPLVGAAVVIVQVASEGYRWHMIPAYSLVLALCVSLPWCFAHHFRVRLTALAVLWVISWTAVLATCLLAGVLYPVFAFVPLTGKYRVGTRAMHLVDEDRRDPYAPGLRKARELMVQFWYPAEAGSRGRRARYRDGEQDSWRTAHLRLVKTRSFVDSPPVQQGEKFPILLFSGPNNRFQNTFQAEELASHGYLVAALDHPYGSERVVFPDGRSIKRRKADVFLDFRSEGSLRESTQELEADLAVRVADVECVMAYLTRWQAQGVINDLFGSVDISRIGTLGHSFGGAVAAELCVRNPNVRAGINMDGWMFGLARKQGVSQPFFFMADCTPRPDSAELQGRDEQLRRKAERTCQGYEEVENSLKIHGGYFLQVPGLEHMNYTDYPLFSQVKAATGAGTIGIRRAHTLVNRFSLGFFDTHLRGGAKPTPESVATEFPEATFCKVARAADPERLLPYRESVAT